MADKSLRILVESFRLKLESVPIVKSLRAVIGLFKVGTENSRRSSSAADFREEAVRSRGSLRAALEDPEINKSIQQWQLEGATALERNPFALNSIRQTDVEQLSGEPIPMVIQILPKRNDIYFVAALTYFENVRMRMQLGEIVWPNTHSIAVESEAGVLTAISLATTSFAELRAWVTTNADHLGLTNVYPPTGDTEVVSLDNQAGQVSGSAAGLPKPGSIFVAASADWVVQDQRGFVRSPLR